MRKSLLAMIALLFAAPANADAITVGWWDASMPEQGVVPVYHQDSFAPFTINGYGLDRFGPTFGGVLSTLVDQGQYESAINNIFATGSGTGRIYTTFSGITTVGNDVSFLNTLFQRTEDPLSGWTGVEQVFICGAITFCDNFVVGGGTGVGSQSFTGGALGNIFQDLFGLAPDQPFNITQVFHLVSDGPGAHWAGAIVVNPQGATPVPGPIAGVGLPGLAAMLLGLLGLHRRRKRVQ